MRFLGKMRVKEVLGVFVCLSLFAIRTVQSSIVVSDSAGGEEAVRTSSYEVFGVNCTEACRQVEDNLGTHSSGCSKACRLHQCLTGCRRWVEALNSTCSNVCSLEDAWSAHDTHGLYCSLGCSYGALNYVARVREMMSTPPEPTLVAGSLGSSSVGLKWPNWNVSRHSKSGPTLPSVLPFSPVVQLQPDGHHWRSHSNTTWIQRNEVLLQGLHPYTKYQFRVAWVAVPGQDALLSRPSSWISTLPAGPPLSPPTATRVTPLDGSRVEVRWSVPEIAAGELVSYTVSLKVISTGEQLRKDVSPAIHRYVVTGLQGNTSYEVAVAAVNKEGQGPAAVSVVSTYPSSNESGNGGYLLMASGVSLLRLGLDIMKPPSYLYNTSDYAAITGLALHIRRGLLYVSDSSGRIMRLSPATHERKIIELSQHLRGGGASTLSVDWLNDFLYILEDPYQGKRDDDPRQPVGNSEPRSLSTDQRWKDSPLSFGKSEPHIPVIGNAFNFNIEGTEVIQPKKTWNIWRSDLQGENLELVAELNYRPERIQVDPFNGYLWWVRPGRRGGLYRLDVGPDLGLSKRPTRLMADDSLSGLVVDLPNFRILVACRNNNSMMAVSLDGTLVEDARYNTQQAYFREARDAVLLHGRLYWTGPSEVYTEEVNGGTYYHNSYAMVNGETGPLVAVDPSAQPVPTPLGPPRQVSVLFSTTSATAAWLSPVLPPLAGEGAWQKWTYEVRIMDGRKVIYHKNISSTHYDISHLRPDTFYIFKVRAYSSSGAGPWSPPFHGRTLRQQRSPPRLLLLTSDGVITTDMSGHDTALVASKYFLQEKFGVWEFSDAVVREDLLVVASVNASGCGVLNTTSLETRLLDDTRGVAAVAVDVLTGRVFWANPHLHLIGWNSLEGQDRATLSLMTGATRLEVDSLHGRLFWATPHAVYYSTLLGRGKTPLHREQLFSGRQVMGLTVDEVGERAFWAVRDGSEGALYCASFGGESGVTVLVPRPLPHPLAAGPTAYIDDRLFFVSEEGDVLISDTDLNSTAVLPLQHLKVQHVRIFNDESYKFFDEEVEVLPEVIDISTVRSEGAWDDFDLTWRPVTNVNFTNVTYEVIAEMLLDPSEVGEEKASSLRLVAFPTEPRVSVPWTPPRPFVPLRLSVRGVTAWGAGPRSVVTLYSPPSLPGTPRALRYFTSRPPHSSGEENDTSVLLRWLPPLRANGLIEKYELELCKVTLPSNCSRHSVPGEQLQFLLHPRQQHDFIFKVAAATSVGFGESSAGVLVTATDHRPLPRLLAASASQVELIDVDFRSGKTSWKRALHAEGRPGAANVGVLLRNMTAFVQDSGNDIRMISLVSNETKVVTTLQEGALALDVDYIAEKLLWLQRSHSPFYERVLSPYSEPQKPHLPSGYHYIPPPPNALALRSLDLNFGTTETVTLLRVNGSVHNLVSIPLHNLILVVVEETDAYDIFALRNLSTFTKFLQENSSESCSCQSGVSLSGGVAYDPLTAEVLLGTVANRLPHSETTTAQQDRLTAQSAGIISADPNGCQCSVIVSVDSFDGGGCTSLAVDTLHIYCYVSRSHNLIWFPRTSKKNGNFSFRALPLLQQRPLYIAALDLATQKPPGDKCLEGRESASLWIEDAGANSAVVHIIAPPASPGCSYLSPLGYSYTLLYRPKKNYDQLPCQHNPSSCSHLKADAATVTVAGLRAFTAHDIQVAAITAHALRRGLEPLFSPMMTFTTRAQTPPAARRLEARSVDPESVEVSFLATSGLPYKLFWQLNHTIDGVTRQPTDHQLVMGDMAHVTDTIGGLRPGTEYLVWVRVISAKDPSVFADSSPVEVLTMPSLPHIELRNATARSLSVAWTAPADFSILRHAVDFLAPGDNSTWSSKPLEQTASGRTYAYVISDLTPAQHYLFRLRVTYNSSGYHKYVWPQTPLFNFSTLDAAPGQPGKVHLQQTGSDGGEWRVWWAPAADHGSAVTLYELEAAPLPVGDEELVFSSVYNGTANRWPVADLDPSGVYVFRVRALNDVGVGAWSGHSTLEMAAHPKMFADVNLPTILAAAIPATLLIFLLLFTVLACALQHSYNSSVKLKGAALSSSLTHTSRELELATLHHLPSNNNFVSEDNILYNLQNFSEEDIDLPRVSQHNVTREKFLGSGAFGEVFEGHASGIAGLPPGGKVAIKMLRKGATETEKCEFLKEAQLMSHFQHDHILRLLAICDDHDPFFLVLELMEGGDLLSYLRSNRAANGGRGLSVEELAAMCVDVARGCQYLEELHFVHRDLAARNCLVSSSDPRSRIVKIGDFGLARDIYKNDYYRKEGEGMLPVRWMSPESLTDGVFTSHSDVWAFGVLLWEIMTLGQQPYPARTNIEVMHYVRAGGRLSLPPNCPLQVETLMEKCWSFSPEERPRFRECLSVLLTVQRSLPKPPLAVHNANYVSSSETCAGLSEIKHSVFSPPSRAETSRSEDSPFGDYPGGCDSGASTVPLNISLCNRKAQNFTFSDDMNSCIYPASLNSGVCTAENGPSQVSEVSTDVSIVSNTLTADATSSTLRQTSPARLQSPRENHFNFSPNLISNRSEPQPSSNSSSSTPSPFLLSLLQHFPENNFTRTLSLRLPRESSPGPMTHSPTSVEFTFNLPRSEGEHYARPVNGRSCSVLSSSSPISPPTTPEMLSACRNDGNSRFLNTQDSTCPYVNQLVAVDSSYTPPQSNKSTPENGLSFMKAIAPSKRSSSAEAVGTTDRPYIDMSPIKISGHLHVTAHPRPMFEHRSSFPELRRSEGSIDTLGYHRMKSPSSWSRLSGLSALSGMSGLTADASTLHLDFSPSQSSC